MKHTSILQAAAIAALISLCGAASAATVNISGGGSALDTAITNANANAGSDTIIIDDSLDYTKASAYVLTAGEDLIIQAAAGQTPTITNTGASGQVFQSNASLTIQGVSSGSRITIRNTGTHTGTQPLINTGGIVANTHVINLENVTLTRAGSGAGGHIVVNNSGTTLNLTNVNFTGGAGVQNVLQIVPNAASAGLVATLNNVDASGATTNGNRILANAKTTINATNSNLSSGAGINSSFIAYSEASTSTHTLTGCTIGADAASTPFGYVPNGASTTNINNPTIAGSLGQVGIQIASGGTVNISGVSAASKASLSSAISGGTILVGRVTNGSLNFTDVTASSLPAVALVDSDGAALTGPVNVSFTRCDFQGGAGSYNAGASDGGGQAITVTATNSIFNGTTSTLGYIFNLIKANKGASTLNLTHATLYNPLAGQVLIQVDGAVTFNSSYSILDATGGAGISGNATLVGDRNLLEGFIASVATPATNLVGVGPIDSAGRISANGLAAGAATGSATAVDVDGTARPQGGTTPDIGAHESNFAPVSDWMTYDL